MEDSPTPAVKAQTADLACVAHLRRSGSAEASSDEISRLYCALDLVNKQTHPRTAQLLASGVPRMAQKVMEEAGDVANEAVRKRGRAVVRDSADLLYNLVVLWCECGVAPNDVWLEMRERAATMGIAEKAPKRSEP